MQQLEFHGVMRFYYQSSDSQTGQKVATKCIRVSSTATTKLIIENLIEKFRPDMKMLEVRPMPHNSPIYNECRILSSKALALPKNMFVTMIPTIPHKL